jgi:hypothetical protein
MQARNLVELGYHNFGNFEEKMYFAIDVNATVAGEDAQKMTATRATPFGAYYDGGALPSAMGNDKESYKKGHRGVLKMCMVIASQVSSREECAGWVRSVGDLFSADPRGQLWDLECSCKDFSHSNNRCAHCVAMAAHLGYVVLSDLIDEAPATNGIGRPRKNGNCLQVDNGPVKSRNASSFQKAIDASVKKGQLLKFHKHKIATLHDGEWSVGYVRTCKQDPNTGEISWIIRYPDNDNTETQMNAATLAEALCNAAKIGVSGVEIVAAPRAAA